MKNKKNIEATELKKTVDTNFKVNIITTTIVFLFQVFIFLNLNNKINKLKQNTNPNQPSQQQEVKINLEQVKKLFTKDFIHFGDEKRKLLIVEVSDPSCPFCHIAGGFNPQIASQVGERFKYDTEGGSYIPPAREIKKLVDQGKASFAFLYSNGHGNGLLASEALYCAFEMGKFWPVHDRLMTNEGYELINNQVKNDKNNIPILVNFLANVIDKNALTDCLQSGKYQKMLERDERLTPSLGFRGTPHFIINTTKFEGAYSFSEMKPVIEKYLNE
ncbi:MAG: DsbA family protein [Microgenomates group bacterium]